MYANIVNDVTSENELKDVKNSKFNGLWSWYINEKDVVEGEPANGMFIFNAVGNNEVKGYTFTEKRFEASPNN